MRPTLPDGDRRLYITTCCAPLGYQLILDVIALYSTIFSSNSLALQLCSWPSNMILTEEDTQQRPKLPMDPSMGPTNRAPPVATSSSHPRPPSPNPTLPDYESSQAQQPSQQPSIPKKWGAWRFLNGRVRKVLLYAVVIYSAAAFIIGIPTFLMASFPPFQKRRGSLCTVKTNMF
jgi:hypothetical protein